MSLKRRKNIRLNKEIYSNQNQIFSLTICTKDRRPIFGKKLWAKTIIETFQTKPFRKNLEFYAYCLMPDHLHLLVSPKNSNFIYFIGRWKSYTANLLNKSGWEGPCWQRGFYDHALRKDEDIRITAEYIVHNPVRKHIAEHWREYPYSWHKWM
ncbi:MAG: transposase [Desulfobacterales bacterium]|nr:MAG: transposase [Desulfobacterales bacterium]